MDPADLVAIHQLYGLYGHVMDDRDWSRLPELFTADCVFDATALGVPLMSGRDAIATATESSPATPLAHHVTNVYVMDIDHESATVRAKALGTYSRGRAFSGDYEDRLVRTDGGWRIRHRLNRPARGAPGERA
jgi:3-phenylpropionate/cinnamic acid dioxygenase small subunit